jgi:hypothetical protein
MRTNRLSSNQTVIYFLPSILVSLIVPVILSFRSCDFDLLTSLSFAQYIYRDDSAVLDSISRERGSDKHQSVGRGFSVAQPDNATRPLHLYRLIQRHEARLGSRKLKSPLVHFRLDSTPLDVDLLFVDAASPKRLTLYPL